MTRQHRITATTDGSSTATIRIDATPLQRRNACIAALSVHIKAIAIAGCKRCSMARIAGYHKQRLVR